MDLAAEPVVYADASALVKLVVRESETNALREALRRRHRLYTSRLAVVEVTRAAVIANDVTGYRDACRVLESCELIDVDGEVLERARSLVGRRLKSLDAVHLASALLVAPEELIAYDRRLLGAARAAGLSTSSPGA